MRRPQNLTKSPTFLEITYLVRSKQSGSLFQIFVAYWKYLNFNDHKIFPYSEPFETPQADQHYCRGIREASKDLGVVHSRRLIQGRISAPGNSLELNLPLIYRRQKVKRCLVSIHRTCWVNYGPFLWRVLNPHTVGGYSVTKLADIFVRARVQVRQIRVRIGAEKSFKNNSN